MMLHVNSEELPPASLLVIEIVYPSKSPGIIQWSDCLMLTAQSLSHWQRLEPCIVSFVFWLAPAPFANIMGLMRFLCATVT